MSTNRAETAKIKLTRAGATARLGNVAARAERPKRGRGIVLVREFEDAGGTREFTLYLDVDEAERLADCLDAVLAHIEDAE